MKVIFLAAGKGERLQKLTNSTPKCLLKVGNKTMLEHWWEIFRFYSITDVLINTHYLANKVVSACSKLMDTGIKIHFVYEKELLGTGKTIYENRDFVKEERCFLIVYADTWMQVDLSSMVKFHKKHQGLGTIGLYKPKELKDQGVVQVTGRKITDIEEKPKKPKDGYAFAGIMIGGHGMFRFYKQGMTDLVRDWLPVIKNGLNPFYLNDLVYDIGTPERYKIACDKVHALGLKGL